MSALPGEAGVPATQSPANAGSSFRRSPAWTRVALAAAAYLLLDAALTWPLALRLDSTLFGDFGDTRAQAWGIWANANGLVGDGANPLLAAPFGAPTGNIVRQPLSQWPLLLLAKAWNEIAAINIFVLLSFPLTATATFVLLQRLVRDGHAAFIGGLAFGFCPAAVMHVAGGHAEYGLNAFVPLLLLAFFHNRSRRTAASAAWAGLAFAGVALTSLYIGYFAAYLVVLFAIFDFATSTAADRGVIARNYVLCAAVAALVLLPFQFAALWEQLTASREALLKAGRAREFDNLSVFAARFSEYLVPSIDHPVLGPRFEDFVRNNLHGSNVFEQTLYLGTVPLGLLVVGIILAIRGDFEPELRRLFLFFAAAAFFMYLLSLPPTLAEGIPTVSYFAHMVVPMFRVYARAGILVNLLVACAAAVVIAHLGSRVPPRRHLAITAVLAVALAFELWSVPPAYALPVNQPPAVYRWLAGEPGDIIVAEYPMVAFDEAAFYDYPFWQRVHRKRLVNGATPDNVPAWELYEKARDLGNPQTPSLLRSAGVKYVIVHKKMYREGPIPAALKRYYPPERAALTFNGGVPPPIPSGLEPHKSFGSDLVFVVTETQGPRRAERGSAYMR